MRIRILAASLASCFLLGARVSGNRIADESEVTRQVDALLSDAWKRDSLPVAKRVDDAGFLRRASLDIRGSIPSSEEVDSFLRETDPEKRRRKIDEMLGEPKYARHWAALLEIRMIGRDSRRRLIQTYGRDPAAEWLERGLATNRPYDALVRDLLTAEGVSDQDGEIAFVLRWSDSPANLAGQTSRLFLGIRLQCAQCHDHPYEKWKQEDFWSMAAYFARVRRTTVTAMDGRNQAVEILEGRRGDVTIPGTKKKAAPRFLEGAALDPVVPGNRRVALAERLTDRSNSQFGRALVNWVWAQFFGRGFVQPVDDFSETNAPVHADVLELLTRDFVESGYDLKRLIRIIAGTEAYQKDSRGEPDRIHFSKGSVRAMTPEQLFRSLAQATGLEEVVKVRQKGAPVAVEREMQGALAGFVSRFENDEMSEILRFELTIPQTLMMMNGRFNVDVLPAKAGVLLKILDRFKKPAERIAAMVLSALSRPATEAEQERFQAYLKLHGDQPAAWIDLYWVLLNSSEFFFNH